MVRTQDTEIRTEDADRTDEDQTPTSRAREDATTSPQPDKTEPQTAFIVRESQDEESIQVTGLPLVPLPHDTIPPLTTTKRETVQDIRKAEKEISKHRLKSKQPPAKAARVSSKQDVMSKDDFVFTRVYGTMNLAVLRQVESTHHARKLAQEREERANWVARVRRERTTKRSKIEAYQNQLRERVQEWRGREEGRLERVREALGKEREAAMMQRFRQQEMAHTAWQRQAEEKEFSQNFKQNNTLISNTLALEDRKAAQETTSASVRERVRQVRRDSLEKQEEARRYMELRRTRLLQKGRESKEELDAKMLEVKTS